MIVFIVPCSGAHDDTLKDHLMEDLDYSLVPEGGWNKLLIWYGLAEGSRPIARKVIEWGMYVKNLKVRQRWMEVHVQCLSITLRSYPHYCVCAILKDHPFWCTHCMYIRMYVLLMMYLPISYISKSLQHVWVCLLILHTMSEHTTAAPVALASFVLFFLKSLSL